MSPRDGTRRPRRRVRAPPAHPSTAASGAYTVRGWQRPRSTRPWRCRVRLMGDESGAAALRRRETRPDERRARPAAREPIGRAVDDVCSHQRGRTRRPPARRSSPPNFICDPFQASGASASPGPGAQRGWPLNLAAREGTDFGCRSSSTRCTSPPADCFRAGNALSSTGSRRLSGSGRKGFDRTRSRCSTHLDGKGRAARRGAIPARRRKAGEVPGKGGATGQAVLVRSLSWPGRVPVTAQAEG